MKRVFLTSPPSHRNASDLIRVLAHHGLTETTTPTSGTARP
ncbi:hypothetical protein [Methylorubrum extorquens]|nr:hypothetical protein [Methylorubrum extorquens]